MVGHDIARSITIDHCEPGRSERVDRLIFCSRKICSSTTFNPQGVEWVAANMSERFTEILRAAREPAWVGCGGDRFVDAVGDRFVKELFAGAVPDAVTAALYPFG